MIDNDTYDDYEALTYKPRSNSPRKQHWREHMTGNTSTMNRADAVRWYGGGTVEEVEADVDFTNRVTDGTPLQGLTEFSASNDMLMVHVYVPTEQVTACESLDTLDWVTAFEDTGIYEKSDDA